MLSWADLHPADPVYPLSEYSLYGQDYIQINGTKPVTIVGHVGTGEANAAATANLTVKPPTTFLSKVRIGGDLIATSSAFKDSLIVQGSATYNPAKVDYGLVQDPGFKSLQFPSPSINVGTQSCTYNGSGWLPAACKTVDKTIAGINYKCLLPGSYNVIKINSRKGACFSDGVYEMASFYSDRAGLLIAKNRQEQTRILVKDKFELLGGSAFGSGTPAVANDPTTYESFVKPVLPDDNGRVLIFTYHNGDISANNFNSGTFLRASLIAPLANFKPNTNFAVQGQVLAKSITLQEGFISVWAPFVPYFSLTKKRIFENDSLRDPLNLNKAMGYRLDSLPMGTSRAVDTGLISSIDYEITALSTLVGTDKSFALDLSLNNSASTQKGTLVFGKGDSIPVDPLKIWINDDAKFENIEQFKLKFTRPKNLRLDYDTTTTNIRSDYGNSFKTYWADLDGPDSLVYLIDLVSDDENLIPDGKDDAFTTPEDQRLDVLAAGILGNDSDGNGDLLSVDPNPVQNVSHGSLILQNNGAFSYVPNGDFNGIDQFKYRVLDEQGNVDTVLVTITVTPVNDAPLRSRVIPDTLLWEDFSKIRNFKDLQHYFSDVDGDLLTYSIRHLGSVLVNGILNGSEMDLASIKDANGTDQWVISATDPHGLSASDTLDLTILAVNDEPGFTVLADTLKLAEDQYSGPIQWVKNFSANSSHPGDEPEQTVLHYVLVRNSFPGLFSSQPSLDSIGQLQFVLSKDSSGLAELEFRLWDNGDTLRGGVDSSRTQKVIIKVQPLNDVPFVRSSISDTLVLEDFKAAHFLAKLDTVFADPESEALLFEIRSLSNKVKLVGSGSDLVIASVSNANGLDTLIVRATEQNGGLWVQDTLLVRIQAVNDAPEMTSGPALVRVLEDAGAYSQQWAKDLATGPANALDEKTQNLVFELISNAHSELFVVQPTMNALGVLSFVLAPDSNGSADVCYRARDNGGVLWGGIDSLGKICLRIQVDPANDRPYQIKNLPHLVLNEDFAMGQDSLVIADLNAYFSDIDGDVLNYVLGTSSIVSARLSGDGLVLRAIADSNGTVHLPIQVRDNKGGLLDVILNVDVLPVNDAPDFSGKNVIAYENENYSASWANPYRRGPVNESEQALQFEIVRQSRTDLFVQIPQIDSSGKLTFKVAPNLSGIDTLQVRLRDNGGVLRGGVDSSPIKTYLIQVQNLNDAPMGTGIASGVLNEDFADTIWTKNLSDLFGDPDGDSLQFSVLKKSSIVDAHIAGHQLRIRSVKDRNGTDSLWVIASDGFLADTLGFEIQVLAVNDAPDFVPQNALATENESYRAQWATQISRGPKDEQNQSLHYRIERHSRTDLFSTLPTIDAQGILSFKAASNINGVDTVHVRLFDDGGVAWGGVDSSIVKSFVIQIRNLNDAPIGSGIANRILNEDFADTIIQNLDLVFSDPDGDALSFSTVSRKGLLESKIIGRHLVFVSLANQNGLDSIWVIGTDGSKSDTLAFAVQIVPVNDAPAFTGKNISVVENQNYEDQWAVHKSRGPSNESHQKLNFNIMRQTRTDLYSVQPSLDSAGRLSFVAAANISGVDTIWVRLSDDGGMAYGGVDTSLVLSYLIQVQNLNDAPIGKSLAQLTLNEDFADTTIADFRTLFADPDGDSLTYEVVARNALLGARLDGSQLKLQSAKNEYGTERLWLIANDGKLSDTVEASVIIQPVNDAPNSSNGGDLYLTEDTVYASEWATNLSKGPANESSQKLRFEIVRISDSSLFALLPQITPNGILGFSGALNRNGSSMVYLRLRDDGGVDRGGIDSTQLDSLKITLSPVNDPQQRVQLLPDLFLYEDFAVTDVIPDLTRYFQDADGDESLVFSVKSLHHLVNASVQNKSLFLESLLNQSGLDSLIVTSTDREGYEVKDTLAVRVYPVNDAPFDLVLSNSQIKENSDSNSLIGRFSTLDPDSGDAWTYALVDSQQNPDNNFFVITGSELRVLDRSALNYERDSLLQIKIRTTDLGNLSYDKIFVIKIVNQNDKPLRIQQMPDILLWEEFADTLVQSNLGRFFSDEDDDSLQISVEVNNNKLRWELLSSAQLVLRSLKDSLGRVEFRVAAADGRGGVALDTFWVQIQNVNDNPVLRGQNWNIAENSAKGSQVGALIASDLDSGALFKYEILSSSQRYEINGTHLVVNNADLLDFEADPQDSLLIRVIDEKGASDTAWFVVNLTNVVEASFLDLESLWGVGDSKQNWKASRKGRSIQFTANWNSPSDVGVIYSNQEQIKVRYLQSGLFVDSIVQIQPALIANKFGVQEVKRIYLDPLKDTPDTLIFLIHYNAMTPVLALDSNLHLAVDSTGRKWIGKEFWQVHLGQLTWNVSKIEKLLNKYVSRDSSIAFDFNQGDNEIVVSALDLYGNLGSVNLKVAFDTITPTVKILAPRGARGQDTSTIFSLLSLVDWEVDGQKQVVDTLESLQSGANVIIRKSCDFAGNCGADTVWLDAVLEDERIKVVLESKLVTQTTENIESKYFTEKSQGRQTDGRIPEQEDYNFALRNTQTRKMEEMAWYDGLTHRQISAENRVGIDSILVLGPRVKITMQFPVMEDSSSKCEDGSPRWKLSIGGISVRNYDQIGQYVSSVSVPGFDVDKIAYQNPDGKVEGFLEMPKIHNEMHAFDGRRWGNGVYLMNVRLSTVAKAINCNHGESIYSKYSTLVKFGYMRDR